MSLSYLGSCSASLPNSSKDMPSSLAISRKRCPDMAVGHPRASLSSRHTVVLPLPIVPLMVILISLRP